MPTGVVGAARAQSPHPTTELVGLWSAVRDFTPEARGALTIAERRGVWQASIAGIAVPVTVEDGRVELELPGDRGAFRGRIDGSRIVGHWIQPWTLSNFAPYASPVTLEPVGEVRARPGLRPAGGAGRGGVAAPRLRLPRSARCSSV